MQMCTLMDGTLSQTVTRKITCHRTLALVIATLNSKS